MNTTPNKKNGPKKIQWKQHRRIAIQKFADLDLHAGVKQTGLFIANMWNANSDNVLCKLDTKMI